jgi:hypothetical protein
MAAIRILEEPHPGGTEPGFDFAAERIRDVGLDLSGVERAREIQQVGLGPAKIQRLDDMKDFYLVVHDGG